MDPKRNELRDRLLAQQAPDPERLAAYRKGVEAMVEHLRRQAWWVGCAYAALVILGTVALTFGAVAVAAVALFLAARQGAGLADVWVPAVGSLACLAGAVALVRHVRTRKRLGDLLLEVKRLEMRVLELEEAQRGRGEQ
jgi:hypothetical protein